MAEGGGDIQLDLCRPRLNHSVRKKIIASTVTLSFSLALNSLILFASCVYCQSVLAYFDLPFVYPLGVYICVPQMSTDYSKSAHISMLSSLALMQFLLCSLYLFWISPFWIVSVYMQTVLQRAHIVEEDRRCSASFVQLRHLVLNRLAGVAILSSSHGSKQEIKRKTNQKGNINWNKRIQGGRDCHVFLIFIYVYAPSFYLPYFFNVSRANRINRLPPRKTTKR